MSDERELTRSSGDDISCNARSLPPRCLPGLRGCFAFLACWARADSSRRSLPAGTSCQRQNQWYHQCLPGGGSGATLNVWDQCGGKGGNCNGYTCVDGPFPGQSCPSGTSCQRKRALQQAGR